MFKKSFIAFLVFFLIKSAGAGYLQIQSVKNTWQKWGAQITGMEFKSSIDGFLARNEMTLYIKDTISNSYPNDSLEAVLNFDLPKNSVIDSMYLLINGVFEPAYLKCAWNATMIYENIVKRRIDPALLKKNGNSDNYTIQIFPFFKREERTIKICYTTVLSRNFCKLSLPVPLEISSVSLYPTQSIFSETVVKNRIPGLISCISTSGKYTVTALQPNGSKVHFLDNDAKYSAPFLILIDNTSASDRGITVNFLKDIGGETFFAALIDPGKLFGVEKNNRKKVCIIWNGVTANYNDCSYYYSTSVENDKNDILGFIRMNFRSGDLVNLVINDHSVSKFKEKTVQFTEQTYTDVRTFLSDSLNTTTKYGGCRSPLDALAEGFKSVGSTDSVWIIIIDRATNINNPYDNLLAEQTAANLQSLLPKTTQFFWFLQPNIKNLISAVYTNIRKTSPGVLNTFSTVYAPLYPLLECMQPWFSEKLYPAGITFSDPNTRFPYDILGPAVDCFYSRQHYVYMGKLYDTKRLKISCDGILKDKKYSFDTTVAVKNGPVAPTVLSDCWAMKKVDQLLAPANPTINDKKQALHVSLQYRILSPLTALLALEKAIADSLKMADDKPNATDTLFVTNPDNGNPTDIYPIIAPIKTVSLPFRVMFSNGRLFMLIPAHFIGQSLPVTLKLFDLNGRCIADLTNELKRCNGSIIFDASNLKSGVYIVRLHTGKKSITRQCIVTH